jgi:hypothetical protein
MSEREEWHDRLISEINARLRFLRNRITVKVNKGSRAGSDIEIISKKTGRRINIEIQQFDSGSPWTTKTIPSWEARHDLYTFIVFTEPATERVVKLSETKEAYSFFNRDDVFILSEAQIGELVSTIAFLTL